MRTFFAVCFALALGLPSIVSAHEAAIRIVVVGEDSDLNAVPRSNEVYKRVVAELQQSLLREKITVIDEDMIGAKLGFSYNEERSKQELLETLMIANETTDATVHSRLGMIFSVFPNIQEMSMTRKLTVRVRGQIYDLKSLKALSSFEASSPQAVTLPLKNSMCNRLCVEEKAGEVAIELARETGAILNKKLHMLVEQGDYAGSLAGTPAAGVAAGEGVFESVYTVKFNLMKLADIVPIVNHLEKHTVREIKLIKSSQTQRVYSVTTNKNLGDLEEKIMRVLLEFGLDLNALRVTSFGTEISIEAL